MLNPNLPEQIGRIALTNANAFGRPWNVEAVGTQGHEYPAPGTLRPRRIVENVEACSPLCG